MYDINVKYLVLGVLVVFNGNRKTKKEKVPLLIHYQYTP